MAKKSTRLEALYSIFEENGISSDTIELNDSLILSDGELRETQTANYFSIPCRIDCAVPPVNACFSRKYSTLLQTENLS